MKITEKKGNEALLERVKTAFICSRKTPEGIEFVVGRWLLGLSPDTDCVMCGNQSPVEKAVFATLLQRKIPAILMLAEAMPDRFDADIETALSGGRLLVTTHCDASVHVVSARSAFDRNMIMLSLAQKIVVGSCTRGGNIERVLAGFDNVEYLESGQPWINKGTYAAQNEQDGMVAEEQPQWRIPERNRKITLGDGTVNLELNDSGAETYVKMTCVTGGLHGGHAHRHMFFDLKELAELRNAVMLISDKTASGEPVPQGLVVNSLSGDVTFGTEHKDGKTLTAITQYKVFLDGSIRNNVIKIEAADLRTFADGLGEALRVWN